MADAADSKSAGSTPVGVQVSSPASFQLSSGEIYFTMPNKKSAERRVRIAERNRLYNKYWTSRCKTAVKKLLEAVDAKDSESAQKSFNEAQSVIDKAVVKGVMHKNTAARRKELMSRRMKAMNA